MARARARARVGVGVRARPHRSSATLTAAAREPLSAAFSASAARVVRSSQPLSVANVAFESMSESTTCPAPKAAAESPTAPVPEPRSRTERPSKRRTRWMSMYLMRSGAASQTRTPVRSVPPWKELAVGLPRSPPSVSLAWRSCTRTGQPSATATTCVTRRLLRRSGGRIRRRLVMSTGDELEVRPANTALARV